MDTLPSNTEINTATDETQSHFSFATGTGTSLPFHDTEHSIVLFSTSHIGMPPIATDPKTPAVRFYGCFKNRTQAAAFAQRIAACDPTCNIQMGDTHKWILACSSASKCTDATYCDAKIDRLIAHHAAATQSARKAFMERTEALKSAGPGPDRQGDTQKTDETAHKSAPATNTDSIAPDTHQATQVPTSDTKEEPHTARRDTNGSFLDASCMLAFQTVLCVAFVKDEIDTDIPEFMFKVLRSCKDEAEASGYIKVVASKHITDHPIDVVDLCAWGFPQTDESIQTTYRNKQLDEIMQTNPIIPTW